MDLKQVHGHMLNSMDQACKETCAVQSETIESLHGRVAVERLRTRKLESDNANLHAAIEKLQAELAAAKTVADQADTQISSPELDEDGYARLRTPNGHLIDVRRFTDLAELIEAKWLPTDDDDGTWEWRVPIYGPKGEVVSLLPVDEWIQTRKDYALRLNELQVHEDINDYLASGKSAEAIKVGLRNVKEHLEAGRETWALEAVKAMLKAGQAPAKPEELNGEVEP